MKCRKRFLALGASLVFGSAAALTATTDAGEAPAGDAALRAEVEALRATIAAADARRPDAGLEQRRLVQLLARVDDAVNGTELTRSGVGASMAEPFGLETPDDASFGEFAADRERADLANDLSLIVIGGSGTAPADLVVFEPERAALEPERREHTVVDWNGWESFQAQVIHPELLSETFAPDVDVAIRQASDGSAALIASSSAQRPDVLLAVSVTPRPRPDRAPSRLAVRPPAPVAAPPLAQSWTQDEDDLP